MNKIEAKNLTMRFKDVVALDDVSVAFEEGKIYGLLGRNGAGKSTLLNSITNRIFPQEGAVTVDGEPAMENDNAQGKIYLMTEKNNYPQDSKVKTIFKWTAEFYGCFDMEKAMKYAEMFELNTNKIITKLSTGYKSIFKNIIALSLNVPYLLLDEPVLGLDANHRDLFYRLLLQSYAENPRTIIISTHLIEEVSSIIENIVIIKKGRILEDTTVEALLASGYTVTGAAIDVDEFISGRDVISEESLGGIKSVYIRGQLDKSAVPSELEIGKFDLQKLFIQLTNA